MIGRADIEGSKSNVAMNAWLPQASYPCGNFSDTSSLKSPGTKGSIGHAFTVCIHTENQNQMSFYPFVLHEISVLIELILGHLRYLLTDVPPQPNSPPDNVFSLDRHPLDGPIFFFGCFWLFLDFPPLPFSPPTRRGDKRPGGKVLKLEEGPDGGPGEGAITPPRARKIPPGTRPSLYLTK